MKKLFLSILSSVLVMSSLNARDLITAEWNLLDETSGGVGTKLLGAGSTGGVADTLANGCIILLTHPKDGAGCSTSGLYVHNSNSEKGDNFLTVTVPGGAKGQLTFTYASAKNTNTYHFYAIVQDDTLSIPTEMYNKTDLAVDLGTQETTKSTPMDFGPIEFDFKAKTQPQTLYVFHVSTSGGRYRTLKYQETELASSDPTGIIDTNVAPLAKKMVKDGQLVIVKGEKIYNILGF